MKTLAIIFLLIPFWTAAQTLEAYVYSAGGINSSNLKSTLGEPIVGTSQTPYYTLCSGFDFLTQQNQATKLTQVEIKIYPTITSDKVFISGDYDLIQVYSIELKFVKNLKNVNEYDLSSLPAGVYIFRIFSGEKIDLIRVIKL